VSQQDVDNARRVYAVLNEAYRANDPEHFRPMLEAHWHQEVAFVPAGVMPESEPVHGWEGVLRHIGEQMKAFKDGSMWLEPSEFIDGGDVLVIPYRVGGYGRHTDLEFELAFVHVAWLRDGKTYRIDVCPTKEEALQLAGL
jgi:hypothetical protein